MRNQQDVTKRGPGPSDGGRVETVIVGGGQAGLAVGYHLARRDRPFVILDADQRAGDAWRRRWDSLHLFTPARYSGLPGWPFPAPPFSYPTRDEVADYLEAYAARFELPVRHGVRVDRLAREGGRFLVAAGDRRWEADQVVVASGAYQRHRIPAFVPELDQGIVQLDTSHYRNPSQLRPGGVLVVGAGNSGAEIAHEVSGAHPTWLSGPDTGHLPVRNGVRVDRVLREDGGYVVTAGDQRFAADHVVVASGAYQIPTVPEFASKLDPGIVQIHSSAYRVPSQLREGGVLVVGACNSGAEIALEAASGGHPTWLSGRDTGHIPFRISGLASRLLLERLVLRFVFHRVLTVSTPIGRKIRPKIISQGGPLIRIKPADLAAAGIERVTRVAGVQDGLPVLDDGRVLDVANVVWCTGFEHDFSWIDLPAVGEHGPAHRRGIVDDQPGLYFVGLHFLYSMSSAMIHGVGRDAEHIARHIARRARSDLARANVLAAA